MSQQALLPVHLTECPGFQFAYRSRPCIDVGGAPETGETTGIPVGVLAKAAWKERTIHLAPGERLYLCTDGLYEAENAAQEEFGSARLIEELHANRSAPLEASLDSLMDRVAQWHGESGAADDTSILAIERTT